MLCKLPNDQIQLLSWIEQKLFCTDLIFTSVQFKIFS